MASVWGMEGKELNKFAAKLKGLAGRDWPKINGAALNQTAFEARKEYVKIAERRFVLRNRWTIRSIRVDKVKGFTNQFSEVGSIMDYMEEQEFGGTKTASGSKGVAIPSTTAANQPRGARPRTKKVMPSRRRTRLNLYKGKRIKGGSRKEYVVAVVKQAAEAGGRRFVYLPRLGHMDKGIYLITGGKKNPKVNLIYDLSRKTVKIPKQPTLLPAVNNIQPRMPQIYKKSFEVWAKKL